MKPSHHKCVKQNWKNLQFYITVEILRFLKFYIQGGSNMTRTNCDLFTYKSVPVIFEPPCIYVLYLLTLT
jgi:hypothetical protein